MGRSRGTIVTKAGKESGVEDAFGEAGRQFAASILLIEDETNRVELAEAFITHILPQQDENVRVIKQIVDKTDNREVQIL